jgi:hypothetical protein
MTTLASGAKQVCILFLSMSDGLPLATTVERVQWLREKAKTQRWEEEIEILEEEFRRTIRSFERMAEVWALLAKAPNLALGASAYALKQAHMYGEMAENCREKFLVAGGTWPANCSLSELISQQRQGEKIVSS